MRIRRYFITFGLLLIFGIFSAFFLQGLREAEAWLFIIGYVLISACLAFIVGQIWRLRIVPIEAKETTTTDRNNRLQLGNNTEEKRKRDRIDAVLRDLSNEDLVILRQRLADGTIDDDVLYDNLSYQEQTL